MEDKMGNNEKKSLVEKWKPYFAMVCLQFGYGGMNLVTKVSLNNGISPFVLVVFSNAFATAVVGPLAIFHERNERPKMTFPIFMQIFVLGLLGPVMHQNLYYMGLKLTSPTFSCTISSFLPMMVFLIALLWRIEKMEVKKLRWHVKVVGTLVMMIGSILMIIHIGDHGIHLAWSTHFHQDWVEGSIYLTLSTFSWAFFFILQDITMRKYKAKLSLVALIFFLGTLQSTAMTLIMEHNPSIWSIGLDINLLACAYAGIITSGIAYYLQSLVMEKRGIVFVTAFKPLTTIIVALITSFIFAYKFHIQSVLGAILIVVGLCSFLWGKYRDGTEEISKVDIITRTIKIVIIHNNNNNNNNDHKMETIFEEVELNGIESGQNYQKD